MKQIESFFWGIIAALGALLLELIFLTLATIFSSSQKELTLEHLFSLGYLLPLAAIAEEILKYTVIAKRIDFFSFGRSVILNSFLVGLGFAAVEALLIYIKEIPAVSFFSWNLIEIMLLHILTAGIIGYYVAVQNPKKIKTIFKAVGIAAAAHLGYNILMIYKNPLIYPLVFVLLGILVIINLRNLAFVNKHLRPE